jgi:hypothetical protein
VASAAVVIGAVRHDVRYPAPGSETVGAVLADRGEQDLVLALSTAQWSLAALPGAPFEVVPDDSSMVGYEPTLVDPHVVVVNPIRAWPSSPGATLLETRSWERVHVVNGHVGVLDAILDDIEPTLRRAGYEPVATRSAGEFEVVTWRPNG